MNPNVTLKSLLRMLEHTQEMCISVSNDLVKVRSNIDNIERTVTTACITLTALRKLERRKK